MASIAIPVVGWAVSPLIGKLLDGAKQLLEERSKLAKGVRKELEKLTSDLRIIKGVLVDAEEKQSDSDAVHAWLGELKKILYDAEDLLDLHAVYIALKNHRKPADKLLSLFRRSERLSTGRKVREITENLDRICQRRQGLGLEIRPTPQQAESASEPRRTTPRIQPSAVLGREDEKSEIVELLLPRSERERFLVLPIVGMAGVGKTTLAKLVLSDQDVAASFKLRVWVYVGSSIELGHEHITMEIVSSIDPERHEFGSWDELQRVLVKEIRDRQPFLLVLDDAWDTDCGRWSDLLQPLRASGCSGRVIVTTRNRDVAKAIPGGLRPMFLKHLEDHHTWTILKGIAFHGGSSDGYPQLEAIGMEIVPRLKGSPLAAKAIGGILNGSKDVKFWRKILMSKQLKVAHEEDNIFSVLMLSYNNLPAILRQCFLYFSLFPKGYRFTDDRGFEHSFVYSYTKYDVVFQLMAQKFFQSEDGIESEDDGSRYIDKLVNKSLLDYSADMVFPAVMIHDLFHMLSELISKDEYLRVSDDTLARFPENLRHVAFFQKNSNSQMLAELKKHTKLRTILFNNVDLVVPNSREILDSWFRNLRCLRVLSLHNFSISSLPDSIGDLQLLRLLNLFLPKLKELPESISRLHNLQVLKVRNCNLVALPKSIVGLVNLRYLDVDRDLLKLIDGIGKLGNLKQLEAFHVDKQKQGRIAELRDLNGLCVLGIINLENVEGREDAQEAGLSRKKDLEELELVWNDYQDEKAHLDVLEGLCPYANLRKLFINGYSGGYFPCWVSTKSLPFLEVMKLDKCSRLDKFSPPGNLHELEIACCPNLQDISTLPSSLRRLRIRDLRKTRSTLDGSIPPLFQINAKISLPFLEKLEIIDCENIVGLGALLKAPPSLNYLHMVDVSHCSTVMLSHLTALSTIILEHCSSSVVLDLTTLSSLKVLRIHDCPHTVQHVLTGRRYLPCNSLCELIVACSFAFLTTLCICDLFLVSVRELRIKEDSVDNLRFSKCLRCATVLQKLVICDCHEITSIPEDVLRPLESLKHLSVEGCEQLKELDFQVLMSLEELRIGKCPSLLFNQPSNSLHQLLEKLVITDLSEMQLEGLSSVLLHTPKMVEMQSCTISSATTASVFEKMRQATTLERLKISQSEGPDEFQLEFPCFSFLKSLSLDFCSNIISLPVLSSLERLRIDNCHNLVFGNTPVTESLLPSLEDLYVSNFSLQQLSDLFHCVARSHLKCLSLCSCKELKYFEGDLEKHFLALSSLEELLVRECENLVKLPTDFRVFRNLHHMEISSCKSMKDLPKEGIPRSLQLKIQDCHALESRYGDKEGNLYIKSFSLTSGLKF